MDPLKVQSAETAVAIIGVDIGDGQNYPIGVRAAVGKVVSGDVLHHFDRNVLRAEDRQHIRNLLRQLIVGHS